MIDDIDRVVEWRRLALRYAHRGAQATLTE
jgi:hypothetical protein